MIECEGKKITPKEASKKIVFELLISNFRDWHINTARGGDIYQKVTDREFALIAKQVEKLVLRINRRYLKK